MRGKCCHDLGHTLKTQKQHISAAGYFLGVYSGSGTILDALEYEQGIIHHLKAVDKVRLKEVKQLALNQTSKKQK